LGRLPVVNFAAGGVATPADAALMMVSWHEFAPFLLTCVIQRLTFMNSLLAIGL
jgi:hypothetical protein